MFYKCTINGREFYIPRRMGPGIINYIDNHILPGSFLQAVFENNLVDAVGRADQENINNIAAYSNYLYWEAPTACWGSPEKVKKWVKMKNCKPVEEQDISKLEIPLSHTKGALSIENEVGSMPTCEFGLQRACDGRVWVCINGVAFIRFKPER